MDREQFTYTTRILRDISNCYDRIYEGIEWRHKGWLFGEVKDPFSIAEYKADFDDALKHIGKKGWNGREYLYYRDLVAMKKFLNKEEDD